MAIVTENENLKGKIAELNKKTEDKNMLNMAIMAENEDLKIDKDNKAESYQDA